MIFKDSRPLIYSRLELIVDGRHIEQVETNDPAIDIYDYYEVIGIRAGIDYYSSFDLDGALNHYDEAKVIISLKETLSKTSDIYLDIEKHPKNASYSQACKK